jgi:hypothetical protein
MALTRQMILTHAGVFCKVAAQDQMRQAIVFDFTMMA